MSNTRKNMSGQLILGAGSVGVTAFSTLTFCCAFTNDKAFDPIVSNSTQLLAGAVFAGLFAYGLYRLTSNNLNNATNQLLANESALSTFKDWKNTTPTALVFALFEGALALASHGAAGLDMLSKLSKLENTIGLVASATLTAVSGAAVVRGFTVRAQENHVAKHTTPDGDLVDPTDIERQQANPLNQGHEQDRGQGNDQNTSGGVLATTGLAADNKRGKEKQQRANSQAGGSNPLQQSFISSSTKT